MNEVVGRFGGEVSIIIGWGGGEYSGLAATGQL